MLRFLRDGRPLAPDEVWLGILPGAALRVTTHFPPLYSHWNQVLAFKPRYSLDEQGELVLRPSPAPTRAEAIALLDDQRALLASIGASDHWIAREPLAYAPRGSSWTHRLASARLALTWHESLGREPAAALADDAGEPYRLLRALVLRTQFEARAAGAAFGVVFLPSRQDLVQVDAQGNGYWRALHDDLAALGLRCLDLGPALRAAGAIEDDRYWMPRGHYSALANALVATTIRQAWFP